MKALGIQGKLYRAVKDLFSNTTAKVRVGDFVSRSFEIKSGVMQGSKLGPLLFLIFINDLLEELNASLVGVSLRKLAISALGFADDIVLLADSAEKLQEMINLCHEWSEKNSMTFNIGKCKIMILNLRKPATRFYLAGKEIKFTDRYKYLGVTLSNRMQTSLITHHISSILEMAEKRVNCIRHFGFQGDGLRPATSVKMYKTLVRPILEYASQALSYKHYYLKENRKCRDISKPDIHVQKLEAFQNRVLKRLFPCPKQTSPAVLRLISGTMPISARIDILKLRYLLLENQP